MMRRNSDESIVRNYRIDDGRVEEIGVNGA